MKMQDALDLAINLLISAHHGEDFDMNFESALKYKQAADILRNGVTVERSEVVNRVMCPICDCHSTMCTDDFSHGLEWNTITQQKRWTEREKIQIIPEKSEPTFEEIK